MNNSGSKITKLEYTRNGRRVNIYIDDEYSFSIEERLVLDFDLYVGKEIGESLHSEIVRRDLIEFLVRKAQEKIARRPNTVFEIYKYFEKILAKDSDKRHPEHLIDEAIEVLKSSGQLNDRHFAEWFFEIKRRKKSINEIKRELLKKGLLDDLIEEVVKSKDQNEDELIKKLILKKQRLLANKKLNKRDENMKLIQYLARKGFEYSKIIKLFEEL